MLFIIYCFTAPNAPVLPPTFCSRKSPDISAALLPKKPPCVSTSAPIGLWNVFPVILAFSLIVVFAASVILPETLLSAKLTSKLAFKLLFTELPSTHTALPTYSVSTSMLYRTSPQQYFVLGLGIGYESAHDKSDAYTNGYARANWTRKWKNLGYLETSVSATIQKKNYQGIDLFNIKRNDTEYFTRLSLNHPKLSWHGFVPNLNWTWGHTDSNHFYYRKKNENKVFIDIAKQF